MCIRDRVKVSATVSVVKLATGRLGTDGDKTITGLEAGKTYRVQNASTVKYTAADGTLTEEAEKAALGEGITAIDVYKRQHFYSWSFFMDYITAFR